MIKIYTGTGSCYARLRFDSPPPSLPPGQQQLQVCSLILPSGSFKAVADSA